MRENVLTIGVLGGMGTYATIHLFEQYAELFVAEKEWERPRIVIDNRCTMPSRVRAYLYNEHFEKLVDEMTDSIRHLIDMGCTKVILACNTSHLFLPYIYKCYPEAEKYIVNIIDVCIQEIVKQGIDNVYLLASEGTIESQIYQKCLEKNRINCIVPSAEDYSILRICIEAVKQNKYTSDVESSFMQLMSRGNAYILGCTELPILYEKYKRHVDKKQIFDPLYICLRELKEEFEL